LVGRYIYTSWGLYQLESHFKSTFPGRPSDPPEDQGAIPRGGGLGGGSTSYPLVMQTYGQILLYH